MAYHIDFVETVLQYIDAIQDLTDLDRDEIVNGAITELEKSADRFHALRPLAHESLCFRYDYPHATQKSIYNFDFIVDAWHADMGVLVVVYVESQVRHFADSDPQS